MKIKLNRGTHTIRFKGAQPRRALILFNGHTWIDRDISPECKEICFNTIAPGIYESPNNFDVIESKPLEIKRDRIKLYKEERDNEKPIQIVYNEDLSGTPARIFSQRTPAIVEVGPKFYTFPPQVRMFILLHEYGHMFYKDEHKTDLYALKQYINLGLNISQAFYALAKVLHRSPANMERIKKLFEELKENGYVQTEN